MKGWPRRLSAVALGLGAAALVVAGIVAAGNLARDSLGPRDRYAYRFADIECAAPPGMDRATFLGEVQYNGEFRDTVNLLDVELPERLRLAFGRHPRVLRVVKVEVLATRRIVVELRFRDR